MSIRSRAILLAGVAFGLGLGTQAVAQPTPGDRSGTPTGAGPGQSAAAVTQAPAPSVPARAAARGGAGPDVSGEVIVTARRVEERLQDVPISITVFNQQQLENRNVVQGQDLATYTPSLSATTGFSNTNTSFAIRGFVQDNGTQPSVGVYFADVVEPRAASNNIPAGDGAGPGDFFDLQNVQVLKGPQGTLFGRNTTGGAILLVPQKPTSRVEGFLEASGGDYNLLRVQGVFNAPINDKLRVRVGFDHEARDGYVIDANTGTDYNDINYYALRGSVVWDILPNVENYTIASYTQSNTHGSAEKVEAALPGTGLNIVSSVLPPALAPVVANLANPLGEAATAQIARERGLGFYGVTITPNFFPSVDLQEYRFINTTTWRASDNLTIKNIASYASYKEDLNDPLFATSLDLGSTAAGAYLGVPAGTYLPFATANPIPYSDTAHQSTISEELQAQGNFFDNRLQYQGGVYLEESLPLGGKLLGSQSPVLVNCSSLQNLVCANPFGQGDVNFTGGRTAFHNLGLYTQATYAITDQLKFTGGFRYTWDHVRTISDVQSYLFPASQAQNPSNATFCNNNPLAVFPIPGPAPNCFQTTTERSSAPTGTADLDYKPIKDLLLYVKYSRGYRAGGVIPQAPPEYQVFQPESVNTYEVGEKYSFRAPIRGTIDITGFYNDFSNQQLQAILDANVQGLGPATTIINAGQSRIYGLELESSLNLFQGFTLDLSYAYLNTTLTRRTDIATTPTAAYSVDFAIRQGDQLVLSPPNKATITATYVLPLDPDLGRISIAGTYTHVDSQIANYEDRATTLGLPAIGSLVTVANPASIQALSYLQAEDLLNLNVNWNRIMRSNFDLQAFVTNLTDQQYFTSTAGFVTDTDFELGQLGEPRMYGFRVRYHFGS